MGFFLFFIGCSKDSLETNNFLQPNQVSKNSSLQPNPDAESFPGPLGSPNYTCECTWAVVSSNVDGGWVVDEKDQNDMTTGNPVEGQAATWLDDNFNWQPLPSPTYPITGVSMDVGFLGEGEITIRYRCLRRNANGTYSVPPHGIIYITYSSDDGVAESYAIPGITGNCDFTENLDGM